VRDGAAKIKYLACQRRLLPLPVCAVSPARDGVGPVVIKKDRWTARDALSLKSFVPAKDTIKTVLALEFYGKVGQSLCAFKSILFFPTINALFQEAVVEGVLC
jgi:hypothetical protein